LKKALDILLIISGIASLLLIIFMILVVTLLGKRDDNNFEYDNQNVVTKRILFVYEFDSLKSKTEYDLEILERDSLRIFKYTNLKDSSRNISFRFNKMNSNLYFWTDQFSVAEVKNFHAKFYFDKYDLTEPIIDGTGPILFNKSYGVLAWDNNWGNQFYFVDEMNINETDLPIFKYN
jgi:hypothetical protein